MSRFDTIVVVDWSGGNDTGPRARKDAIWAAVVRDVAAESPVYLRNRVLAEAWLAELFEGELRAGRRVMAGFDFPFGYPAGFARALTGQTDPLALWAWFAAHLEDTPKANNRFELAGQINACFPGVGPFWFNGTGTDIPDLPRKGTARGDHGLPERRRVETRAKGSFACWQMGGSGAVGGQVMTGISTLYRLKSRFSDALTVWPFEPLAKPIALVEVWPSLLADQVRDEASDSEVRDATQVRVLARALWQMQINDTLDAALDAGTGGAEEGWILGVGAEAALIEAAESPALRNDCFALPPGMNWTPVDTALAHLRDRLHPVTQSQVIAISDACGRVLAADQIARRSNPPAANSAVDGYGFAHDSLPPSATKVPLHPGRAAAGAAFGGVLPAGKALRILTGAILPDGVDTVVLEEDVRLENQTLFLPGTIKPGANTRRAGEDVTAGGVALRAGHRLTPADLALLSAVGIAEVPVRTCLRVGVLSIGDELARPGETTDTARTFDANRPMLLSLLGRLGHAPVDLGHVGDDRAALRQHLDDATSQVDAILTSGGASAGDEDHVSALLEETGTLNLWRIAVKPGRPLALGQWQGKPIFGLPGNPVAALICALIFARPALERLAGGDWADPQGFIVPAAFEKRKKPGRREYLRARMTADGRAEVFPSEGSGRISGLSWADGLVELEDGARHVRPGDPVRYVPFASFGL
ncbi:MAG: molybdopterin molybdenumtransferase MoeA [Rhodobacteraceae bacterium]|nr:molybdopterin molybdenumtransferase MoeA [Paracoccaceae bacterium]